MKGSDGMKHYDYIIIGFGKGGKTLAADLAAQGKAVAMIEKSNEMYGGTCINIACIPTKLLIHHADKDSRLKNNRNEYYQNAIEDKNNTIAALREKNYKTLADQETIMVYTAEASFVATNQIHLKAKEETLDLTADYFIINTGSEPVIPPIDGLKEANHVYTSTELLQVAELPEKLIIVGGGYIGLEFAVMYANFGSEITVIDSSTDFMENDDKDIAGEVLKVMQDKGIPVVHGSKVTAVSNHEFGVEVTLKFHNG